MVPETPVSVLSVYIMVGGWQAGLVFLDVVLGQEDPVLQVCQGGAEVLGLVSLPPLV